MLGAGALLLSPILNVMPLEPHVANVAFYFLCALAFGIMPLFGYTVLRSFMDALGQTRVTMLITLVSLPVNILLNYLLIFGRWGFPQLGGVGAGVATACTYWLIFLISLFLSIVWSHSPGILFSVNGHGSRLANGRNFWSLGSRLDLQPF